MGCVGEGRRGNSLKKKKKMLGRTSFLEALTRKERVIHTPKSLTIKTKLLHCKYV